LKRAPAARSARLDDVARRVVLRSVERARREGQTRWLARVDSASDAPALDWYARAAARDRFLFEPGDSEDFSVAVGVSHEIESAGSERFRDVRAWARDTCARIDWVGAARAPSRATFFGGFGFEPESRGAAEWKAFPAARFVLPEWIVERVDGETRCVSIVRVEPGATVESIEAELLARRESFDLGEGARETDRAAHPDPAPASVAWPASPERWESGPEYRVRSDRSHGVFRAQVEDALAAFGRGVLAKVVLARSLSVEHDGDVDLIAFLARLRALYPTCTLVAMGRGNDTFLAATPETLVRVRSGRLETAALAGSAARGRTPEEDAVLARRLLENPKERAEHAHVVEAIREVLEESCEAVEIPAAPTLRKLFGIQHLETPIRARLATSAASDSSAAATDTTPVDVLGLVDALHPTPAVCGVPRAEAQAWLARCEGLDRGWYAAPIGWLDTEGGGDFRVALRSALVQNGRAEGARFGSSRALLFAGAGLVEGSDPEQELVETRIKLRALLAPLTEI